MDNNISPITVLQHKLYVEGLKTLKQQKSCAAAKTLSCLCSVPHKHTEIKKDRAAPHGKRNGQSSAAKPTKTPKNNYISVTLQQ